MFEALAQPFIDPPQPLQQIQKRQFFPKCTKKSTSTQCRKYQLRHPKYKTCGRLPSK